MEPLIYHYTSIETLACILKSGKVRFNRLDNVNDPQETKEYQDSIFAKAYYVSCWSNNPEESIPLWKLYGGNLKGVRIGIPRKCSPSYLFRGYETTQILDNKIPITDIGIPELQKLDIEYLKEEDRRETVGDFNFSSGCGKKYKTFSANSDLPKYKHPHWAFEKEIRFLFSAIGTGVNKELIEEVIGHLPAYFDLSLQANFFSQIEITYGPHCNDGEIICLETLLEHFIPKFDFNIQLKKSIIEINNDKN